MAKRGSSRTRRDRWADWAVILLLAAALLLGWVVMDRAEGRQETFTDTELGLTLRYPRGWLQKSGDGVVFQAVDPTSSDFRTTYQVRAWPIDATAVLTPSLAGVLDDASLARAQEGTAYRLFEVAPGQALQGRPTMEATYVYVAEASDPFTERMPVIVRGLDVAVPSGERAVVFSLLASEDAYERVVPRFVEFVQTAELR